MTEHFATTPFGGARMSASLFKKHRQIASQRRSCDSTGKQSERPEKWGLIRALSEARMSYSLSDRAIMVLEALLSFHPVRELDGTKPIIVFPSNAELSVRSRGMADATLRRHIASLVALGLILRRDSPNGKRYCLRSAKGSIEDAFGFDLSPLALMAPEIFERAEQTRAIARACQRLRSEITIHTRDIAKLLAAAETENFAGDWATHRAAFENVTGRLPRSAPKDVLESRVVELARVRAAIEKDYLAAINRTKVSANDDDYERHYKNTESESHLDSNQKKVEGHQPDPELALPCTATSQSNQEKTPPVPLSYLRRLCPALESYGSNGVDTWQQVVVTTRLVASLLGISPDAWNRACLKLGPFSTAIAIAVILERGGTVRSPGGYLRTLTQRAEKGLFSVTPMLAALESPSSASQPKEPYPEGRAGGPAVAPIFHTGAARRLEGAERLSIILQPTGAAVNGKNYG